MTPFEIEGCLKSFQVLYDTREQNTKEFSHRLKQIGNARQQKLEYGDYTYNFTFPDGSELYDKDSAVNAPVVVERKMSLVELSNNFCERQQKKHVDRGLRNRFEEEFWKAKQNNARVYLLVENASWHSIYDHKYKTKFHPNAYISSLLAFTARYQLSPIFCNSLISGRLIHDILYRELKEKLESGFYG